MTAFVCGRTVVVYAIRLNLCVCVLCVCVGARGCPKSSMSFYRLCRVSYRRGFRCLPKLFFSFRFFFCAYTQLTCILVLWCVQQTFQRNGIQQW